MPKAVPQNNVGNISMFAIYTAKNALEMPSFAIITKNGMSHMYVWEKNKISNPPSNEIQNDIVNVFLANKFP